MKAMSKGPPSPPNDSPTMQTDSSCEVADLRSLITGKQPLPKLELFTQPIFKSKDVRQKDSETVEKKSKFNKSEKARLL